MADILKPQDWIFKEQVKDFQEEKGLLVDGILGPQTWDAIYRDTFGVNMPLGAYHRRFYGADFIFGNHVGIIDNDGQGVQARSYKHSIGALFKYNKDTISLAYMNGKPLDPESKSSCHYHIGKPESVIYTTDYKEWHMTRALTYADLPSDVKTAIGGLGVVKNGDFSYYSPVTEGFSKGEYGGFYYDYTDMFRKTHHAVFGIMPEGQPFGALFYNMTVGQIIAWFQNYMPGVEFLIVIDGGHVPAGNFDGRYFNGYLDQANLLQFY